MDLVTILTLAVAVAVVFSVYYLFNGVPAAGSGQRRTSRR